MADRRRLRASRVGATRNAIGERILQQQRTSWTKTVAPGEVIYAEGFSSESVLYVITDGKVEISTQCDDKKVVVATLGKGEFFGEATLLGPEPRSNTAKALSF